MDYTTNAGASFRATATGTVCITSANGLITGILFTGTGTGIVSIFCGTTSTGATSLLGKLIAYPTVANATANQAAYFPFPAYASGGVTLVVGGSADPSLCLFWNPAGG